MPVAPTYPGVYIEELPSGVHTITGVATSIAAFIGFTPRGGINSAVHIFSYADYERAFGGLAVDSPMSYAVKQFFQNGGTEAYVVRVAKGATKASVMIDDHVAAGTNVLLVTAASEGTWGNNLQIDVDYATYSPGTQFNMTVTEFVDQNGQMVPGRIETFRNLSMNSFDAGYVVNVIAASSKLITVTRPATATFVGNGTSTSGAVTVGELDAVYTAVDALTRNRIAVTLNGVGPLEFDLFTGATPLNVANTTLDARLNEIAGKLQAGIVALFGAAAATVTHTIGDAFMVSTSGAPPGERSAIHFSTASRNDGVGTLRLALAGGAVEADASAARRPARTGTTQLVPLGADAILAAQAAGSIDLDVWHGNDAAALTPVAIKLDLWGPALVPPVLPPKDLPSLVPMIRAALARSTSKLLDGATVSLVGRSLRILPGSGDPNNWFQFSNAGADTTATTLTLTAADENAARYAPGIGAVRTATAAVAPGNDGTATDSVGLIGDELNKTGMYALEGVDLFNLLIIPELLNDAASENGDIAAVSEAIDYCVHRRAFMIVDAPAWLTLFSDAQNWINSSNAASIRNANSALYFPRLREPDPLMANMIESFPAAGSLAGLYARTDAERGVWKAPAGTTATIVGATGLAVTLTDMENGVLNPLGLNCLRTLPVYGTISWGARTSRGADALADQWKYIPVRRLALFLEESLYRGTQWAVFEPNDEPLWAQIRLNLGAFMHELFAQGAFQGKSPRDAYFVKCDSETTTQNDIDLGRVNIVVGFAPLKPAEFVIIKIQQIAGAIQT